MSGPRTGLSRRMPLNALRSVIAVVAVAGLILAFNGGIRVGFGNHSVLLTVVRRMLNPDYLPGDFGIPLRWYHHRAFLYLIAAISSPCGEDLAIVLLSVAGQLFLSFSLYCFCRTLGLSLRGFLAAGLFLALSLFGTGLGLELNTFVGSATIMPPTFAHGLILLVVSSLMTHRRVLAGFLIGLTFLIHTQIGFIFGIVILPFFVVSLRGAAAKGREILGILLAALLPSLPAIGWLAELMKGGLASSTNSLELIAFRMPHHFEILAPNRVLILGSHLVCLGVIYGWLRRVEPDRARRVGLVFALSITIVIASLFHFVDYYLIRHGAIAKLQFIRLTPCITVFGTTSLLLGLETWMSRPRPVLLLGKRLIYPLIFLTGVAGCLYRIERRRFDGWTIQKYAETKSDWVEICAWIREHGPRGVVYLTPPGEEGFTYLADRSNVVEFKNNPDGGFFVEEWLNRLRDLSGGILPERGGFKNRDPIDRAFAQLTPEQLAHLSQKYSAGFAVLPRSSPIQFEELHHNDEFRLVRIPKAEPLNRLPPTGDDTSNPR